MRTPAACVQAFEDAHQLGMFIKRAGGGFDGLQEFREARSERLQPIMLHAEVSGREEREVKEVEVVVLLLAR